MIPAEGVELYVNSLNYSSNELEDVVNHLSQSPIVFSKVTFSIKDPSLLIYTREELNAIDKARRDANPKDNSFKFNL